MPRAITPSFVQEFEVRASPRDLRVLRSRLEAGRQLYNAILGEALRRLFRMRRDPAFAAAKALPRGKSRSEAFRALRVKHGFQEYDLHQHPSLAKDCWLRDHLDVHAAQKVATRAFRAAERWAFGASDRPRFKRYGELESLEGKSNAAGIRFREERILWSGAFGKLDLPLVLDMANEVHAHAIGIAREGGVKYCRLLTRTIRGRERAFAQLVLEGEALRKAKHPVGDGVVGLDLGPSQVAVVTEGHAETMPFCHGLDRKEAARRRYQRKLDRQRRANSPENYNPGGTVKPQRLRKPWKASRAQVGTRTALAEVQRALAAQRKALQGHLAHQILALGNRVVTEKVNKRSWAKLWGRSVGHKAPGMLEARLKVLAEASGGSFEAVPTRTTYLSSRCLCGLRRKKPLSERRHTCGCPFIPEGMKVDRDEFSAFLAMHCQGGLLDEEAARKSWRAWGADCLLRPLSSVKEAANGEAPPPLRAREARRSGSVAHEAGRRREALPGCQESGERREHLPKPRKPAPKEESHVA